MAASELSSNASLSLTSGTDQKRRLNRWTHPKQKIMVFVAFGVIIGSFLPWLETAIGSYTGFAGPGQILFYFGFIGMGAGLVPLRWPAIIQSGMMGAVAVVIPLWQIARMLLKVGISGWVPGVGMVLIFGCGAMALRLSRDFWRANGSEQTSVHLGN